MSPGRRAQDRTRKHMSVWMNGRVWSEVSGGQVERRDTRGVSLRENVDRRQGIDRN